MSHSIGDGGSLAAVAAVAPDEIYAVGGDRVLRFNGLTWAIYGQPPVPDGGALRGVWAGDDQVVVVGDGGFIARRTVGELGWTVEDSGVETTLRAVSGRGAGDLWAVGAEGTILHYAQDLEEGAAGEWTSHLDGSEIDLHAVWVDQTTEGSEGVLAVGSVGTLVRHSGGAWAHQQIAANTSALRAILGLGELRVAVGTGGVVAVRATAASSWKGEATNLGKPSDLLALATDKAGGVYAFGANGAVLLRSGTSWSEQPLTGSDHAGGELVAAARVDGTLLALDGAGGGVRREGDLWKDFATAPTGGLAALLRDDAGRRVAVGAQGLLLIEGEHGWTSIPTGVDADLLDVTLDAEGALWAVGKGGTVITWHEEDGVSEMNAPVPTDLFSVVVVDDTLVIGGKGGTLLRAEGHGALLPWAAGITQDVRALEVGGDGALWLAGAFGKLARSADGQTFESVTTGVGGSLNALAATADGVLVVGDNGVVLDATAAGVETLHEQPGLFLYGVAGGDQGPSFAVGWNGTALRREAGGFVAEDTGTHALLEDVLLGAAGATAVGRMGSILERVEAP